MRSKSAPSFTHAHAQFHVCALTRTRIHIRRFTSAHVQFHACALTSFEDPRLVDLHERALVRRTRRVAEEVKEVPVEDKEESL